jgi:hypothetical protein
VPPVLTEHHQQLPNQEVPFKEVHPHEAVAAEATTAVVHHQAEVIHRAVQEVPELQGRLLHPLRHQEEEGKRIVYL